MKVTRCNVFGCEFGRLEFIPAEPGFKVLWTPIGGNTRRVGWTHDRTTPTLNLARFYIRCSVAEDRGLPKYTYTDQNKDPEPLPNQSHDPAQPTVPQTQTHYAQANNP